MYNYLVLYVKHIKLSMQVFTPVQKFFCTQQLTTKLFVFKLLSQTTTLHYNITYATSTRVQPFYFHGYLTLILQISAVTFCHYLMVRDGNTISISILYNLE